MTPLWLKPIKQSTNPFRKAFIWMRVNQLWIICNVRKKMTFEDHKCLWLPSSSFHCCIRDPLMHTSIQGSIYRTESWCYNTTRVGSQQPQMSQIFSACCELWKLLALSLWVSGRWFVTEIITMWMFLFCWRARDILQCQLTRSTVTSVTDGDVFGRRLVIDDTFPLLWSLHRDRPSRLPRNPVQGVKQQCSQC